MSTKTTDAEGVEQRANGSVPEKATPKNVIEALSRVMAELPGIGKDGTASAQQGGYAYRGIEAITGAAQKLLGRYGVVFVPRVTDRKTVEFTVNQKPWTEEQLTVEYQVYGPGGASDTIVVGPLVALGRDNSDKGTNKAMTQAFKYALLQVLCIGDAKSDGDGHDAPAADAPRDPEAWFKENGWESKAEHDEWRTETIAAIKSMGQDDQAKVKAWQESNGLDWKRAIKQEIAAALDLYLDHLATKPAEATEKPATALCPDGCGWEPHNCRCAPEPF